MTKQRKKRQRAPQSWLVFIDTNILLDFYRYEGQSAIRTLDLLEKHKDRLILGDQLRMEFMNNRQRAVLAGIEKIGKPQRPTLPAILLDSQPAKTWLKAHDIAEKRSKKVRKRIEAILNDPIRADPVYQRLAKIFDHDTFFNLRRPDKRRFEIRRLARKRFSLGYPPRKPAIRVAIIVQEVLGLWATTLSPVIQDRLAIAEPAERHHSLSNMFVANINLGLVVGITGEPHFVACQFRQAAEERASPRQQVFY
jgi:predicted nucleic acid-binding protein